jgi:hypothetical protein
MHRRRGDTSPDDDGVGTGGLAAGLPRPSIGSRGTLVHLDCLARVGTRAAGLLAFRKHQHSRSVDAVIAHDGGRDRSRKI